MMSEQKHPPADLDKLDARLRAAQLRVMRLAAQLDEAKANAEALRQQLSKAATGTGRRFNLRRLS
jgi:multidrug resistance efflux pump